MSLTLILSSDKDLFTNIRLIGILFSVVGDIGDMSEKSMSIPGNKDVKFSKKL